VFRVLAVAMINPASSRCHPELRLIRLYLTVQGIDPESTTETDASSSSSPVTGEIRPAQSSSDLSEHARDLLVSPCSFSNSSISVLCPHHRCSFYPEVDPAMNVFRACLRRRPMLFNSERSSSTPRRPRCFVSTLLNQQPCPLPRSACSGAFQTVFISVSLQIPCSSHRSSTKAKIVFL
jgi:hypothetical protein